MEKNDNTSELKELIGKNKFKEVLKILSKNKEKLKVRNLVNELYLLKRKYQDIEQRKRLSLPISEEKINEFTWELLQFIDRIENPDDFILIDETENVSPDRIIKIGASLTVFGVSVLGITLAIQAGLTATSIILGIFALIIISVILYFYES